MQKKKRSYLRNTNIRSRIKSFYHNVMTQCMIYVDLGTCCRDILTVHHLSSFTYSATKFLEHSSIHPRSAMRSACGNSVMARCARKGGNFSRKRETRKNEHNISSYVAGRFCEQFLQRRGDVPWKSLETHLVGDGIFDFAHLLWHTAPLRAAKLQFVHVLTHLLSIRPLRTFWDAVRDVLPIRVNASLRDTKKAIALRCSHCAISGEHRQAWDSSNLHGVRVTFQMHLRRCTERRFAWLRRIDQLLTHVWQLIRPGRELSSRWQSWALPMYHWLVPRSREIGLFVKFLFVTR